MAVKVTLKSPVADLVGNARSKYAVELKVKDADDKLRGTLSMGKGTVSWRRAGARKKNYREYSWDQFIQLMEGGG